ncbi:hypothetical protein ATM97_29150 [Nocardia sp. MH4]|nr:hypothetical protein [Nocardia sp. MH4]
MTGDRGARATVCAHCGQHRPGRRHILDQPVCPNCELRFRRKPRQCPHCDEPKILAFYDKQRRPSCAACTGNEPIYACPCCNSEDKHFGAYCAECTLEDRLMTLLNDPATSEVHHQLVPVFRALMDARDPRATLYWLTRPTSRPDILADMANGALAIAHTAFDELPTTRNVSYVHDLLVATGVLTPHSIAVDAITRWLTDNVSDLPKAQADLVRQYARWRLLRRLRQLDAAGNLTAGSLDTARAALSSAVRFLTWLNARGLTLASLNQHQLDDYLTEFPTRASTLGSGFLRWTTSSRITHAVAVPVPPRPTPNVAMAHDLRWDHVQTLLHNNTIRGYTRVAGLFMLLFAQPLVRTLRMRRDQIEVHGGGEVTVTFDSIAIELPDPLNKLVIDHLDFGAPASYATSNWLFPGRNPGKPLVTENVRGELVSLGIPPNHARQAAMFQLASEMPTAVLAEVLGLNNITAIRWATLASRDWAYYAALRREPT